MAKTNVCFPSPMRSSRLIQKGKAHKQSNVYCGPWQLMTKHFFKNRSFAHMYIFEEGNFRNSCNVYPHSRNSRPGFQPVHLPPSVLALFNMPNLNRFDILSISIFCKIALSISISISIFSKITISISISISIFLELPYRYRYFSELPCRYRYRYRYFQLLHIDIDIDIDIFQKCRYIDNRYFISIF